MISEAALWRELARFPGWDYATRPKGGVADPRYPVALPGVKLPLAPPTRTDCVCVVEAVVVGASGVRWSLAFHRLAVVAGPSAWATDAYVAAGLADPADSPGPWTISHGWDGVPLQSRGHTSIIVAREGDRLLCLDAAPPRKMRPYAVGWRGLGPLEADAAGEVLLPDPQWWTRPTCPRVADYRQQWPQLRFARLRVG